MAKSRFNVGYNASRKQREKAWENSGRTFKPAKRRWESPDELRAMSYPGYLKSQYWRENRYQFLKAASFRCQKCRAKDVELHVHHKTYEHRGCEWMFPKDVIVFCKECHKKEHGQ
ncbi:hypothetical protein [Pseudodesulfovibrio profundus]|uniref:hypothetical protein n=1 Tax=Pseudodesulfovibrio profundus TaxID=57320 RepID=UPI0012FFA61A|nr:hypothetical protein [Pseudodesulfovibrio profundus]